MIWESLGITSEENVRFCPECKEKVYFCVTDGDTLLHAKAGHCIARELPDEKELPKIVLGKPKIPITNSPDQEKAREWNSREKGVDDSLENINDSSRSCPECGYPAPGWRKTCRVCGFEMGRDIENA